MNITKSQSLKQKPTDENALGFGRLFTDHMLIWDYSPEQGWHDMRITPYAPLYCDPAMMVFHYGQAVFEGLKAYRQPDGGISLFRAFDNFKRMNISNERLGIPEFDAAAALAGLEELLKVEKDWVPNQPGTSLYIRPTIIASDPFLGVRASHNYIFFIILSPVGAYYPEGLAPISIYVEKTYVRAVRGGMGYTKAAGNYAASIKAGDVAKHKGYAQVLWLDGIEQKYIEEVGSMNMFFVIDGKLITPSLNGSILAGITRDSIIKMAKADGMTVEERKISVDEVFETAKSGRMTEAFGTGTAAVVSPVGVLAREGESVELTGGRIGTVAQKMYDRLTGIQYGRVDDAFAWMIKVK